MEDFHFCWETTLAVCDRCAVYIIYLENRMDIFCFPLWVLPTTDVFFVQLRILVFDCEGLFKSFDNTVFGHPPTVSKRGFSIQSGANWESWSGTQIWPQILPYFPPNLDVPIKYQYFFNIMLKKKVSKCQHTAPNTVSRRDTHTVGTSPTNPRVQENY